MLAATISYFPAHPSQASDEPVFLSSIYTIVSSMIKPPFAFFYGSLPYPVFIFDELVKSRFCPLLSFRA
jgi:hypothetical protein